MQNLLKTEPEARESSARGGEYYSFVGPNREVVRLMTNRDEHDDEPLYEEAAEWTFIVYAYSADADSPFIRALDGDPEHLIKVASDTFE